MTILINGRPAAVAAGVEFEYIQENRLFDDAEGFSLDISFPLEGCKHNLEIFGNINRLDVDVDVIVYDAEIIAGSFNKKGVVAITELSDVEIKAQFLEGRSARSFHQRFDNTYINEMSLGSADDFKNLQPAAAWNPISTGEVCVALPWVNTAGESAIINNLGVYKKPTYNDDLSINRLGSFEWHEDCKNRSFMPYLLWVIRRVLEVAGYEADLSALEEQNKYRYLLICHTLPASWGIKEFARYLPHWTIEQFLSNLELFLDGVFEVNGVDKKVVFRFNAQTLASLAPVVIDNVVDEYSADVTAEYDDVKCDFVGIKNLQYPDMDFESWKYLSCDWFLKEYPDNFISFRNMQDFLAALRAEGIEFNRAGYAKNVPMHRNSMAGSYFYIQDLDAYFIWRPVYWVQSGGVGSPDDPYQNSNFYKLQPLNVCGRRIVSYVDDDDDALSIGIRPADIEFTEEKYGEALFMSFSSFNENDPDAATSDGVEVNTKFIDLIAPGTTPQDEIPASRIIHALLHGEKEYPEYFSNLNLAWWGRFYFDGSQEFNALPHPWVEDYAITNANAASYINSPFRISDRKVAINGIGADYKIIVERKYSISFISDSMPDPMALFLIRGKKYICKQIKAKFDDRGMSQLLEGEFYRVLD